MGLEIPVVAKPADHTDLSEWDSAMNAKLLPLEQEITEALYDVGRKGYDPTSQWTGAQWTQSVKSAMAEIALRHRLLQFPNKEIEKFKGSWSEGGEWLYDIVWVDAPDPSQVSGFNWARTRRLVLACESEWIIDEYSILEDFLKLTFCNADFRVFIYNNVEVKVDGRFLSPVEICRRACLVPRNYRYLLIGFPPNRGGEFRVDSWVI